MGAQGPMEQRWAGGGEELRRVVELLVRQVGHWQEPRWAARATDGDEPRSDVVHRLVQEIADLAADVEGVPRREVPRLDSPLVLPDQLRVVAEDLIAAGANEETVRGATAKISLVRRLL